MSLKEVFIQSLTCFIILFVCSVLSFTHAVEEPVWIAEKWILIYSATGLTIYFAIAFFVKKRRKQNAVILIVLYLITMLIPLYLYLHEPKFDSKKWKGSKKDSNYSFSVYEDSQYVTKPAYGAGRMAHNVVKSKLPIGLTKIEVLDLFGEPTWKEESSFIYGYTNSYLDGCNKLYFVFDKEFCNEVGLTGCD